MNEENKIGYYAVIPATILFDKELKPNEKLLYAVITALSNKEGYCYASNTYLGERTVINMYNNFIIKISLLAVKDGLINI